MKDLQQGTFQQEKLQFEQWLDQRGRAGKQKKLERQQAVFKIPVVVHVIHNGEAIGSGTNISDAQVLSQISVLNKDYSRTNADALMTPAEFLPLAGSMDVEFVLAKQDPEGLATTGIVRVQGTQASWSINDNYELKALSYWPAEDYLNIWVTNLSGVLGYAQFPVSNLPGLETSSDNRLTDGVVIAYNAFGSEDDGPFVLTSKYRKGRTTTHEVAHFLGLRHIWGDDDGQCGGTDFVNDTPNQGSETLSCPTTPLVSCNVSTMFQNYLDYTDDACMNLFTMEQVGRMTTVLENSPRRASLLTSPGLSDPLPIANDLGIRAIISPLDGECDALVTPIIEVRNYGSNLVSSSRITLALDGVLIETKNFTIPPLSPLQ
ncbi:MAG TPA: zinc metalloprotease, partial [Chryseolinea sp.]